MKISSNLILHFSVWFLDIPSVSAFLHPPQLSVGPLILTSSRSILNLLVCFSLSSPSVFCCTFLSSVPSTTVVFISIPGLPGTGSHGVPFMFMSLSQSHDSSLDPIPLMAYVFMTPSSVPTMCSPDSSLIPSHIPFPHLYSPLYDPLVLAFL